MADWNSLTPDQQKELEGRLNADRAGGGYGGGKKGGGTPVPDYKGDAAKDQQSSVDVINAQTQANRPDQVNSFGASTNWTQGPNGQWTQTQSLGGPLGDASKNLMGQIGGQQSMDWGQFGNLVTGDDARKQAIEAAYGQAASRLDPQWQQRETQLSSRLANQGLDVNSQAYKNAMQGFNQGRNDAYGSAMNSAIGQGTAAGQAVFGQNMAQRQQMIAEALRARGMPMEELQKLQGLTGQSGFMGAGKADATNNLGASRLEYDAWLRQQELEEQKKADAMNGLGEILPF